MILFGRNRESEIFMLEYYVDGKRVFANFVSRCGFRNTRCKPRLSLGEACVKVEDHDIGH